MVFLLFISIPPMIWASSHVVTGFNCEVTGSSTKEWHDTHYGRNGGTNGGYGSNEGRLFEFDCQTEYCFDSEGERSHYWVTCGFSWEEVDDLSDSDMVIVDVKTWSHDHGGSCYGGYKRALSLDATGWEAVDTHGHHGHWGFWFCYREESWAEVKRTQTQVVVDMTAKVSSSASGFAKIGQWDTHNGGTALAYGDYGRTGDWLYLFSKKQQPPRPKEDAKVIGSWNFRTVTRPLLSDIDYEIKKTAESSEYEEMTTLEMNAWANEISESHAVEVAVQADASYGIASGSVAAAYGYEYGHTKSQQFENQLQNIASNTFRQSKEVTKKFVIPAQVDGEPKYLNIWFFQTVVISSDLEKATHYQVDSGLEVHGCGYHIAPNCLPGYCAPYDPNCWTCSADWAIIDPDFIPPEYLKTSANPECVEKDDGIRLQNGCPSDYPERYPGTNRCFGFIWGNFGCNIDPENDPARHHALDRRCVYSGTRGYKKTWVQCGYLGASDDGIAGHCKTNALNPNLDWCRNYMRSHPNAIAFQWAQLYGWQGHCVIHFDSTITICPSGVTWYQNWALGTPSTLVRDGSCGTTTGTWYYEYLLEGRRSLAFNENSQIVKGNRKE